MAHPAVKPLRRRRLTAQHASFNPAAVQRQIQALSADRLTLATAKNQAHPQAGRHPTDGTAESALTATASQSPIADLLREATKKPTRTY